MIIDAFFKFTGGTVAPGNSDGITDSPTTGSQTSSFQLDIGLTGLPPSAAVAGVTPGGGGARDLGIGDDPALKLMAVVTTAFTGGTNIALNIQGAPDNGSGAPGAFTVMATGPTVVEATLIAGTRLFDVDLPRQAPGQPLPRYLQLGYVTAGTHGAGKLEAAFVLDRYDQVEQANAISGSYPAGIIIGN